MPSARRDFGGDGDGRGHLVIASPSKSSKCLTSGGRDPGKVCVFPFRWRGIMFYGCTREGRDGEWCPTEIHGGNMTTVDGRWGYCGQGCGDMQKPAQAYSQDLERLIQSLTAEVLQKKRQNSRCLR